MTKTKTATRDDSYAVLCDCGVGKDRYMICGVLASQKEARELAEGIKDCASKHIIRKCKVHVRWL